MRALELETQSRALAGLEGAARNDHFRRALLQQAAASRASTQLFQEHEREPRIALAQRAFGSPQSAQLFVDGRLRESWPRRGGLGAMGRSARASRPGRSGHDL